MERTSAVPTIWAKCFALTTQKFNKGRTKPNLSPNGDRSGYKFRSVQGRGQAFFGETSWNGTRPPHSQSQALWAEPLAGSSWNGTSSRCCVSGTVEELLPGRLLTPPYLPA